MADAGDHGGLSSMLATLLTARSTVSVSEHHMSN